VKGKQMNLDTNSNEFKAFKKTVGFFALASICATAFVYLSFLIPMQYIIYAMIFGMFTLGFSLMYSANLEKLKMNEKYGKEKQV
jgi:hypothetical protein